MLCLYLTAPRLRSALYVVFSVFVVWFRSALFVLYFNRVKGNHSLSAKIRFDHSKKDTERSRGGLI